MSPSGRFLSGLVALFAFNAACAPSNGASRAPLAGADGDIRATTASEENPVACTPVETAEAPETPPPAPRPPRPPVAQSKPIYVPPTSGVFGLRLVDENHRALPRFFKEGRAYVMGKIGTRYSIEVSNRTSRRVEVVLSVDGLDAMDGLPANYAAKRGYILAPYATETIDGFRTSVEDVATFRFSSVADSYAGRLGEARDVGVIGAAFFPEQPPPVPTWQPPPPVAHAPAPTRSAPPPAKPSFKSLDDGYGEPAPPAAPASQPMDDRSASAGGAAREANRRPGLGTEFGEARTSHLDLIPFQREDAAHPREILSVRYNDRAGLVALGIPIPPPYAAAETDQRLRETSDPFRSNRFAQPPP